MAQPAQQINCIIANLGMYPGGKATARYVLEKLNQPAYDGLDYLEPFVGLGHMLYRVERKKSYTASDANAHVVILLQTLQSKKMFPTVDEKLFRALRANEGVSSPCFTNNELVAFASVSTFNGINWKHAGFAGNRYSLTRANYYRKLMASNSIQECQFSVKDYTQHNPRNSLIYCDAPYKKSSNLNHRFYGSNTIFDHDAFWKKMRQWSVDNIVYISELQAPDDFTIVSSRSRCAQKSGGKVNSHDYHENLYMWKYCSLA